MVSPPTNFTASLDLRTRTISLQLKTLAMHVQPADPHLDALGTRMRGNGVKASGDLFCPLIVVAAITLLIFVFAIGSNAYHRKPL